MGGVSPPQKKTGVNAFQVPTVQAGRAVRDNGMEPGCPSLFFLFFSPFFRRFSFGGLLGAFVSAVLQVTYGSAAPRILSRGSERRRRRPGECRQGLSLMKASR